MDDRGTVLLTGASGYVGAHVLHCLLSHDYQVIAAVRNVCQARVHFAHLLETYSSTLAFVQTLDLCRPGALDPVLKLNPGIHHVIHLACPNYSYPGAAKADEEMFAPSEAVNSNLINSIHSHGHGVRAVVIGSCFHAMMNDPPRFEDPSKTYSARDINPITKERARLDAQSARAATRAFAEAAAWRSYTEILGSSFSLITIALPLLLGPPLHNISTYQQDSALWYIQSLLEASNRPTSPVNHEPLAPLSIPFYIDVRMAALAFVRAIEARYCTTTRWFVACSNISPQHIVDVLHEKLPPHRRQNLPQGNQGSGDQEIIKQCGFDPSDTEELIGNHNRIDLHTTIADTVDRLLEFET
uniref:ARAD1C06732p n=1 Tax=Blastobotrys adeninivorans TaxID=409370 RepID=A0A060SZD8_BLAAD